MLNVAIYSIIFAMYYSILSLELLSRNNVIRFSSVNILFTDKYKQKKGYRSTPFTKYTKIHNETNPFYASSSIFQMILHPLFLHFYTYVQVRFTVKINTKSSDLQHAIFTLRR